MAWPWSGPQVPSVLNGAGVTRTPFVSVIWRRRAKAYDEKHTWRNAVCIIQPEVGAIAVDLHVQFIEIIQRNPTLQHNVLTCVSDCHRVVLAAACRRPVRGWQRCDCGGVVVRRRRGSVHRWRPNVRTARRRSANVLLTAEVITRPNDARIPVGELHRRDVVGRRCNRGPQRLAGLIPADPPEITGLWSTDRLGHKAIPFPSQDGQVTGSHVELLGQLIATHGTAWDGNQLPCTSCCSGRVRGQRSCRCRCWRWDRNGPQE